MRDELIERDDLTVGPDHETEPLIRVGERTVLGPDRAGEPALVDSSPLLAEGEVVVGVEPETSTRGAERPWHPGRSQSQHATARLHSAFDAALG